jgi:hypothetical protein
VSETIGSAEPTEPGAHPPRPVLTLRVGISGHRPKPDKFPEREFGRVKQQLGAVFVAIDEALAALGRENVAYYAQDGAGRVPHTIRLVSGLAEGADQFAVDARPAGWELDAILPFPEASYRPDFEKSAVDNTTSVIGAFDRALAKATTKVELPDDPRIARENLTPANDGETYWRIRNQGYARLGKFLLGQIDVLVVVWDGLREEGPGGTAEVARGALVAGIPVIWISAVKDVPPGLVTEVDDEAHPVTARVDVLHGDLRNVLSRIISVPAVVALQSGHGAPGPSAKERLDDFFNESWPTPSRSVTYDLFKRFMEGKTLRWILKPPTLQEAQGYLDPFLNAAPPQTTELARRVRGILCPRYIWADVLAVERSNLYRSAYINCYMLAALLVAIALVGVFVHDVFHDAAAMLAAKATLVLAELLIIWVIFHVVRKGRAFRWQERWVEYRALAEMLRSVLFLAYLGEHGYVQRSHDLEPASSAWFLWYLRATIRELGLPNATLDGPFQEKLLDAVEKHVVDGRDGQIKYNDDAAAALTDMHHVLHVVGDYCFILTAVVLGVFLGGYAIYFLGGLAAGESFAALVGWGHHDALAAGEAGMGVRLPGLAMLGHVLSWAKGFVTFFAALLPALGASVFGIRETGDFEGFAKRAARTAEKLKQIKLDFAKARRRLTLETTDATLLATAQILSEDVGAWQSIYGRKQLNLPG